MTITGMGKELRINKAASEALGMNSDEFLEAGRQLAVLQESIRTTAYSTREYLNDDGTLNMELADSYYNNIVIIKDINRKIIRLGCKLCAYITMMQNGDPDRTFSAALASRMENLKFHMAKQNKINEVLGYLNKKNIKRH